jgi:hypothetical protein
MRVLTALFLILVFALPALAQPQTQTQGQSKGPALAGQWSRMPRDARTCYMTGAAAGARAFAETQPGTPMPARIDVPQAVTNMDHFASDPTFSRLPMMAVALKAIMAAQDTGIRFVESGTHVRDPQFDAKLLFDDPEFWPINLEVFVPTSIAGAKPTFAHAWLATIEAQKQLFAEGFGDMAAAQCLERFGDTPSGSKCLKPLLPLPMNAVIASMDTIYRDKRYANAGFDLVIRAALAKMVGDDWEKILAEK